MTQLPVASAPTKRPWWKRILRVGCLFLFLLSILLIAAALWFLRGSIERGWVRYPRYEAALEELREKRVEASQDEWNDYRCVVHSHSYLSHDSIGTPEQILAGAKAVGLDAIFMTDHPTWDNKQLTQAMIGDISGVLFFPGYEKSENMGLFPGPVTGELTHMVQLLPLEKRFDNIHKAGGLVVYMHPESPDRQWDNPFFDGMEIYNIHTDFKHILEEDRKQLIWVLVDDLLFGHKFPTISFRMAFREPKEFLARFDDLNEKRRVFATAGNDAHQNVRIAIRRTPEGKLGLYYGIENELMASFGGPAEWLAGMVAEPSEEIWAHQLDPYPRSFAFVNTYLLAREKTAPALFEALKEGRGYVAFAGFLDPAGFRFSWVKDDQTVPMGVERTFEAGGKFVIHSPVSGQIRLIRNGQKYQEFVNSDLALEVTEPGVYRVEVHIPVAGEWWPWIYSNPIDLRAG